jgi:hypothetical protein
MTMNLESTLQYEINKLNLVTHAGTYDLRSIFTELNIFDHILQPCMSGNILLMDAQSINSNFVLDGSEFIEIDISKEGDNFRIQKAFKVYKQTDRKQDNLTSESFILHFISDEFVYSEQQTISQYYKSTYSEVVTKLLSDKLKVGVKSIPVMEKSKGVREIIIPQLKPLEAIMWCAKRALNDKNLANFLFFENINGYNFVSLSALKSQTSSYTILFEIKNIQSSLEREFFGARDFEIISQYDYLDNIRSGVYAGTFIGFDPVTKTIVEQKINYNNIFYDKKLNKNGNVTADRNRNKKFNVEMDTSKIESFPTPLNRDSNSYIKSKDPYSNNIKESPQYFVIQRKAILKNLFSQRLKIALPGNFLLSSGIVVDVNKQKNSTEQDDSRDQSIYGKYLIVATRHIIQQSKHETVIEVATDSTNENIPGG